MISRIHFFKIYSTKSAKTEMKSGRFSEIFSDFKIKCTQKPNF